MSIFDQMKNTAQQAVTAALAYDPERDAANPSGSVFCDHGSGTVVDWRKVPAMAHVDSGYIIEDGSCIKKSERKKQDGIKP